MLCLLGGMCGGRNSVGEKKKTWLMVTQWVTQGSAPTPRSRAFQLPLPRDMLQL